MPAVLRSGPYHFYFYSSDGGEPPHVHVARDDLEAKFWLGPARLAYSAGFRPPDIRRTGSIIEENQQLLLGARDEFFS